MSFAAVVISPSRVKFMTFVYLIFVLMSPIAPDKVLFFQLKSADIFLITLKNIFVGTHQKRLIEALLMSAHNICFRGEIRKILCE